MGDKTRKQNMMPIMLNRVYTCDPAELLDIYTTQLDDSKEPGNDKSAFIRADGLALYDGTIVLVRQTEDRRRGSSRRGSVLPGIELGSLPGSEAGSRAASIDFVWIPVFIDDDQVIPKHVTARDLDYGKRPKLFYRSVLMAKPVQIPRYEPKAGIMRVEDKTVLAELTLPQLSQPDEIFIKKLKGLCKENQTTNGTADLLLSSDSEDEYYDPDPLLIKPTQQNRALAKQVELFKIQMDQIQRRLFFKHTGRIELPPAKEQQHLSIIPGISMSQQFEECADYALPRRKAKEEDPINPLGVDNSHIYIMPQIKPKSLDEEKKEADSVPKQEMRIVTKPGGIDDVLLIKDTDFNENSFPISVSRPPSNKSVSFQPVSSKKVPSKLNSFQPISGPSKSASDSSAYSAEMLPDDTKQPNLEEQNNTQNNRTVGGAGDEEPMEDETNRSTTPADDLLQGNINSLKAPILESGTYEDEALHIPADDAACVLNGGNLYRCTSCDCAFPTTDRVNSHVRLVSGPGKLHPEGFKCNKTQSCNIKGIMFPTYEQLLQHRRDEHKETWLQCLHCSNQYSSQMLWTNHMRNEHDQRLLNFCVSCQKYYANSDALKRHRIRRHTQTISPTQPTEARVFFLH